MSQRFYYAVFSYLCSSKIKIFLNFFDPVTLQKYTLRLSSMDLCNYWGFICLLFLYFIALCVIHKVISSFLNLLRFILCSRMWCFQRSLHVLLSRTHILRGLGQILHRYMLGLFNILCHLIMMFSCLFCPDDLYIRENRVFKSPTIGGLC